LIEVKKLEKSYGATGVLRGLDLEARPGEVLTLLGQNGAGKTTLLRILATLTRPDSGHVRVQGLDPVKQGELVRQATGVVMHSPMLYGDLTVRENLLFFGRMFRLDRTQSRARLVLERMEMDERADVRVRHLSHGQQKRVALARALLHQPRMLLLDEPESGLDQRARRLLEDVIDEFRAPGRSVVMTTHELDRGIELADHVVVMHHGRVALEQSGRSIDRAEVRRVYSELSEPD
jgi:heme ABC exporter ATP-binding subunit CcmA